MLTDRTIGQLIAATTIIVAAAVASAVTTPGHRLAGQTVDQLETRLAVGPPLSSVPAAPKAN